MMKRGRNVSKSCTHRSMGDGSTKCPTSHPCHGIFTSGFRTPIELLQSVCGHGPGWYRAACFYLYQEEHIREFGEPAEDCQMILVGDAGVGVCSSSLCIGICQCSQMRAPRVRSPTSTVASSLTRRNSIISFQPA